MENGYRVDSRDVQDLASVKADYRIPTDLQSCHTAIVDGYIIEGHVPVAEINRLLAERPQIVGLAVPGMPIGSPGMEAAGSTAQPFDVIAWDKAGQTQVYASYPQ
ncbi:MAG TPA: DUF411 domain-containing protein [Caldilineaceae bacterium]|nr:DUF411 domain-containing protein [Caldilineaceae bacterium]